MVPKLRVLRGLAEGHMGSHVPLNQREREMGEDMGGFTYLRLSLGRGEVSQQEDKTSSEEVPPFFSLVTVIHRVPRKLCLVSLLS